ncbi:c-type cytochrome [Terrimonas sp. NA20]|uniref:C-type cytochrome n=1 Tax=Terrimonas ginsenosidimutans TaxID=2908004 RepID=A0ABS9KR18_9BACT|nr:c-type cytochrome [Terrimonas ginsenosidimutans]MCG2614764.1 c-type cytochrome [Terrimonas ginsenosidimutans]
MRKFILAATVLATLAACGGGETKTGSGPETKPTESSTDTPAASDDLSSNPDYKKGLELIAQSDCFTCHKVDEAYTGPTYRQVADKYAAQAPGVIPELAKKIIDGGTGVWGSAPMIPHPSISQEDAEAMVKYILLLKK